MRKNEKNEEYRIMYGDMGKEKTLHLFPVLHIIEPEFSTRQKRVLTK